jgi:hypothetical protein
VLAPVLKRQLIRQAIILFITMVFGWLSLWGQSNNYYAPFHRHTKDSTKITVSKFGHYVSFGLGWAEAKGQGGLNKLASYSFVYKSHALSLTAMDAGPPGYGGAERSSHIFTSYCGMLLGESIRMKNFFLSVSAGVSYYQTSLVYPNLNATSYSNALTGYFRRGISYPIELKLFFVTRNYVGFGLHASKNGDPFYWGISIVFGNWNRSRVKN